MTRKSVHCSPGSFIQSLIATMETLLNKHVMNKISESDLDIEEGKVRNARDFLKELCRKQQCSVKRVKMTQKNELEEKFIKFFNA